MKPLEEFKTNAELVDEILSLPNNKKTKTALGKFNREKLELEYLTLQDELETATATDVTEQAVEPVKEPEVLEEPKTIEPAYTAFKADEKFKTEVPTKASDIFLKDKPKTVESVIDLDIHKKHYYFSKNVEGKVLIENLGFGDVYYGSKEAEYGDKSQRLFKGQTVELDGKDPICLVSSSSPRVKVTEI